MTAVNSQDERTLTARGFVRFNRGEYDGGLADLRHAHEVNPSYANIRLAEFVVERLRRRGDDVELVDAKAVNLPMLDRMCKEYPKGDAPAALEQLAQKIRAADGFVFVTGEYNWGVPAGLEEPH